MCVVVVVFGGYIAIATILLYNRFKLKSGTVRVGIDISQVGLWGCEGEEGGGRDEGWLCGWECA